MYVIYIKYVDIFRASKRREIHTKKCSWQWFEITYTFCYVALLRVCVFQSAHASRVFLLTYALESGRIRLLPDRNIHKKNLTKKKTLPRKTASGAAVGRNVVL